ncbi:MAG: helix-turn-helix transcriptional regulator [Clostridia bacterium]|nr:helix-turn-helix transcriptional regulator [Clostridia bacterium]
MSFGKNLELFRKNKGYSQEELAFAVGVSRQTLYAWEADASSPNVPLLKSIADALDVTVDDLVRGRGIEVLPDKLKEIRLEYVKDCEPVTFKGMLDWFIRLNVGNTISFGLYDNGKKGFSYHLTVMNETLLHNRHGYEVLVEEYNHYREKTKQFIILCAYDNCSMQYLGKIDVINGVKYISSFKDDDFKANWGDAQTTNFANAKQYNMWYGNKKQSVIQVSYFINEGTFIEAYMNEGGDFILWRRYDKKLESNEIRNIAGVKYGFSYECVTDKILL